MKKTNASVKLIIGLAKTQTILSNRFDRGLGGLGFSEFLILYHLAQAAEQKMRRVDIADKIGLTASGVTRQLLPMEKVHYVKSGPNENDARVRWVIITDAGKQRLTEALERLELLSEEIIINCADKKLNQFTEFINEIGGRALMR
jgi:DNA-binding MarR family transcriptional regulator